MSVTALRLRNFRGFHAATIELKPLTVLLGPNSSGKSSFGHALAAMAHGHWAKPGPGQATLTPGRQGAETWPVDLGDYRDLRTDGVKDRVYIDLLTAAGWVSLGFGNVKQFTDLRLSYIRHPVGIRSAPSPNDEMRTFHLDRSAVSSAGNFFEVPLRPDEDVIELTRRDEVVWVDSDGSETQLGLDGLVLNTVFHTQGGTSFKLSYPARKDMRFLLDTTAYLRGVRRRPLRLYEIGKADRQEMGYSGEFMIPVYYSHRRKTVDYFQPPEIPNDVARARKVLDTAWSNQEVPLETAVSQWLHHFRLADRAVPTKSRTNPGLLSLRLGLHEGGARRDITEIGFGVSQLLPVILQGLLLPKGGLLIADLPEAHLHPNPQAEIADFFCAMVLAGRRALVETHSEMFFHQLRLRAAMNQDLADNIAVYFIDSPDDGGLCRDPRKVNLSPHGEITWPVGFLDEAWTKESQIKLIREAREKTR